MHSIMEETTNIRPFSIYRHTPVFQRQRLTVPALPRENPAIEEKSNNKLEKKNKVRRKKEENVKKSEDIEGYRGNEDVDSILQFIGAEMDRRLSKKNRKSSEKNPEKMEKDKNKKNARKEDGVSADKQRKKKEKACDKDVVQDKEGGQDR